MQFRKEFAWPFCLCEHPQEPLAHGDRHTGLSNGSLTEYGRTESEKETEKNCIAAKKKEKGKLH